ASHTADGDSTGTTAGSTTNQVAATASVAAAKPAAVATTAVAGSPASALMEEQIKSSLQFCLPVVGFVVAILCWASIWAAHKQIKYLKKEWMDRYKNSGLIRPFGNPKAHLASVLYSWMLPLVIAAVWFVVFCNLFGWTIPVLIVGF